MAELPDELWRRILEMGVSGSYPNPNPNRLTLKDLCCICISCRRFRRLSSDDSLWSSLLSSDFPAYLNTDNILSSSSTTTNSRKSLYRARCSLLAEIATFRLGIWIDWLIFYEELGMRKIRPEGLPRIGGRFWELRVELLNTPEGFRNWRIVELKRLTKSEQLLLNCPIYTRSGNDI